MLESLLVPDDDTYRSAQKLFLAAMLFTLLAILFTYHVMPFDIAGTNMNGFAAVFFVTIALVYPLTTFIRSRDKTEVDHDWGEMRLIDRHFHEAAYYLAAFTGVTLGFAATIHALPEQFFAVQALLVQNIQAMTGQIVAPDLFTVLVLNNTGVLLGTFALSFFITGGLVFILVLNASNLGYVIGKSAQSVFEIPVATLPYVAHGTLEIGGYIAAGLAGMLLSYSIEQSIKGDDDLRLKTSLKDATTLMIVGFGLILLAASVESGTNPISGLIQTVTALV
ncbi:MAG: stage II sporulation protein M [Candidatus Nanohaloarchaeota archaeon QJJ-5]|nr:stage II sporulation protein M [Candidatus Nanohaloarchaeota archaeon QJJ-5]